jgi:gamma-glutamyltranspeptidase
MELAATGTDWAIACPHSLATEAGAVAFERGGNAIDAALAAATTLAVCYPHACGVGGDLFALIQRPSGEVIAVNASGRAPKATDVEAAREAGSGQMPHKGPLTVTVPGAVSGWELLHSQGAILPWSDAFSQAIAFAHGGLEVSRSLGGILAADDGSKAADPGLGLIFFPGGKALSVGELFRQPALGETLQAFASEGASALYEGDVGRRYVEGMVARGCPISLEDLRAHRADLVSPLRSRYRDLDVMVVPPNSQGFVLLEALTAVERLEIDPDPFGPDAAALALVLRAAATDRDLHLSDPDRMRIHPSTLLEDGHIAAICDDVRRGMVDSAPFPSARGGRDTVALVTADSEGNAVSLIQSLYESFGSGILEASTGIVAHNRGACFSLEPGHPNELAPGVRPAHTLMPVLAQRQGRPFIVAGTMGGHAQPQINTMTVIRAYDLGLSPADAVAAPRWLSAGMEPEENRPFVRAETGVPATTLETLSRGGFTVEVAGPDEGAAGHAHMIRIGPKGFEAGSDPRADGSALAS